MHMKAVYESEMNGYSDVYTHTRTGRLTRLCIFCMNSNRFSLEIEGKIYSGCKCVNIFYTNKIFIHF